MEGIIIIRYDETSGPRVDFQYPSDIIKKLKLKDSALVSLYEQHVKRRMGPNFLHKKIKKRVYVASFFTGFANKYHVGKPNYVLTIILSENDEVSKDFEGMVRRIAHELLPKRGEPTFIDLFVDYYELLEKRELGPYWDAINEMDDLRKNLAQKEEIIEEPKGGGMSELINTLTSSLERSEARDRDGESVQPGQFEFKAPTAEDIQSIQPKLSDVDIENVQAKQIELEAPTSEETPFEQPELEAPTSEEIPFEQPELKAFDIENAQSEQLEFETTEKEKIQSEQKELKIFDIESVQLKIPKTNEQFRELIEVQFENYSKEELVIKVKELQTDQAYQKEDIKILEDQLAKQNLFLEEWNSKMVQLKDENENLSEIIKELKINPEQQGNIPLSEHINQTEGMRGLENQIADHEKIVQELKDKISELKEQNTNLNETVKEFTKKINKLSKEVDVKKLQIIELKNTLKNQEDVSEKDKEIEELMKKNEHLIEKMELLSKETKELKENYEREIRVSSVQLNAITNLKIKIKKIKDDISSEKKSQDQKAELISALKKDVKVLRRESDHYRNIIKEHELL